MDMFLISMAGAALAAFLVVSVLATILAYQRRQDALARCHYRPVRSLMSGNTRRCYQLLNDIFGQKFYIIPQVGVSALLSPKANRANPDIASNFIDNKIVDFVFCSKNTLRPVCAVKLDSGKNDHTPGSDPKDLTRFFKSAHLPFIYLNRPKRITRESIIEDFSRVIYETSLLDK